MQQARGPPRGESRRGGAKPRGRNEMLDGWCRRPMALRSRRFRTSRGVRPGSGRAKDVSVEGRIQVANPRRGRASVPGRSFGSGRSTPREARQPCGRFVGVAPRSNAAVATARSAAMPVATRERSRSAEDERFAARKRHPGDVLEGPGPVTVEGRGGRRKEPTDLPPRAARERRPKGAAETTDAGFCWRRSAGLEGHPNSTEAARALRHRRYALRRGVR
jgi:hypothetical protein